MTSFVEERLNTDIRYGMVGGPEFNTSLVITAGGHEYRNQNWAQSRPRYRMADDLYSKAELADLISFFQNRKGQAEGFRFKDWADFLAVTTVGNGQGIMLSRDTIAVVPDGSNKNFQLYKKYITTGSSYTRLINKPRPAVTGYTGAKLYKNGTLLTYGSGSTQVAFDESQGWVTFVTAPAIGDLLTWSGEFDVPVRFATDNFNCQFVAYRDSDGEALFAVTGLDILGLKL
jgi:uncharacterized protein (TIGR02217 family)